jgi:hypothetical protein
MYVQGVELLGRLEIKRDEGSILSLWRRVWMKTMRVALN